MMSCDLSVSNMINGLMIKPTQIRVPTALWNDPLPVHQVQGEAIERHDEHQGGLKQT
jgi:hypothetical protein